MIMGFCVICSMPNCVFSLSPYISEHTRSSTVFYSALAHNSQRTWQPRNHGNRGVIHAKGTSIVCKGLGRLINDGVIGRGSL